MSADNSRAFAAIHASNEFLLALDAHRGDYIRSLAAKIKDIESLWGAISGAEAGRDALGEVERLAHSLAGTAGTFGLVELSFKGRVLELLVQDFMQERPDDAMSPRHDARVRAAIASIRKSVRRERSSLHRRP